MCRVMNVLDGFAVVKALKKDYKICVITGGDDPMVRHRIHYLGITDYYAKVHHKLENDEEILKNLASKISKNVMIANDEKRKYIHLTAVFACNFVNHLYARAKEISDSQGIPFDYFLPLIDETTQKIHELEPKLAQTGPAIRNDEKVLKLHESLLTDEEKLKIYKTLNESIKKMYH